MTDTDTINAAVKDTGLSFTEDSGSFSFRQIDAGFTTGLALGTWNFVESLAFIRGWKAARGLPNRTKIDVFALLDKYN